MGSDILYGLGLAAYMGVMILVGYLVKDRIKTSEDYLVGGRSFGLFFNSATLVACFIGGAVLIATPGRIYSVGLWDDVYLSGGALVTIGGGFLCLLIVGSFYLGKMWRCKFISLGDFFYARFGRKTGMVATFLMSLTFIIWIAVQILVFGKIVNAILGWNLETSIIVAMVVICSYTVLGGLFAVCFTDIIQVSITLLGLLVLVPYSISAIGGWDVFSVSYNPELVKLVPADDTPGHHWIAWLAALSITALGNVASPDLMQRAFSAKTANTARGSAFCAAGIFFLFAVLVTIAALCGVIMVANGMITDPYLLGDEAAGIAADPELILPVMSKTILPLPLLILFLGAALSAVMSAAATSSLALAGVVSMNIYRDIFKPGASEKEQVRVTRITVLVIGVIGTVIALSYPDAMELCALCFDLLLAALAVTVTLGLFWKKANTYGAMSGMIAGMAFRVIGGAVDGGAFTLEALAYPMNWYYFTLGAPLVCLAVTVVVSLATQKSCPPLPLPNHD
ncbi:MAG: hypothetical protein IJD04_07265 [Desulfovibrionaceae bacterium]|nr:hypothetical protein [Desulfovibrionaceae bacterium]